MATVLDNLVVARPCPPGCGCTYTYTLASPTGEIIQLLEDRYGPRDRSFTLLGIEFCGPRPQTWFPNNCQHVVIQLSESAMNDEVRALYQLAHECVHLLDPVVFAQASVFEEGVATLFSAEYVKRLNLTCLSGDAKYDAAAGLAQEALALSPNVIRELRSQGKRFSGFTVEQMRSVCQRLTEPKCRLLCAKFQTWDGTL
jgi:hypothetical protein